MAKKTDLIPFQIFVGGKPIEDLSAKEYDQFQSNLNKRMGQAMNDYFNAHPDEFLKLRGEVVR